MLAAGLGVAGAITGVKSRQTERRLERENRTRTRTVERDPLLVAILDGHKARLEPLLPDIESAIGRSMAIEALPASELYGNYTIDLLQQTGRYDVVSMIDTWIPYFGRRGYLTAVPELSSDALKPTYPIPILNSCTGVDGTELVAYPWTFDYACSAMNANGASIEWSSTWQDFFRAANASQLRIGAAFGSPDSAAESFRAILLSFGTDLINVKTHEPSLAEYAARRALETSQRLARASDLQASLSRNLVELPGLATSGAIDLAPVVWASDTRTLWADASWELRLIPSGRTGYSKTCGSAWMWGVPAGAPSVDVARRFVQYMISNATQVRLWPETGLLPATRSAINSAWDPGGESLRSLTLRAIDHLQFAPKIRSFRTVMELAEQMTIDAISANDSDERRLLVTNEQMRDVLQQEGELRG